MGNKVFRGSNSPTTDLKERSESQHSLPFSVSESTKEDGVVILEPQGNSGLKSINEIPAQRLFAQ